MLSSKFASSPLSQERAALLRQFLAHEGHLGWTVEGRSMAPTLQPGWRLDVLPLNRPLLAGDLLLFLQGEVAVVHRAVHRKRGLWITQGDGCIYPDRPVTKEQWVGVVACASDERGERWPPRLARGVALFWIGRYHWLRFRRFLEKRLRP